MYQPCPESSNHGGTVCRSGKGIEHARPSRAHNTTLVTGSEKEPPHTRTAVTVLSGAATSGIVLQPAQSPRSYVADTTSGTRHRTSCHPQPGLVATRGGRQTRPPSRLDLKKQDSETTSKKGRCRECHSSQMAPPGWQDSSAATFVAGCLLVWALDLTRCRNLYSVLYYTLYIVRERDKTEISSIGVVLEWE